VGRMRRMGRMGKANYLSPENLGRGWGAWSVWGR